MLNAGYDLVGNQTRVGSLRIGYDAENRQRSLTGALDRSVSVQYEYDGEGNRVTKSSPAGTTVYVYDAFGQLPAEYSNAATAASPCRTCYLAYDHLGSVRMVMDEAGNVVGRHDYLPFGEEVTGGSAGRNSQFGSADGVNQKFTGQERDSGTAPNLDYFSVRYFNGEPGRFLSPDPENAGAGPLNPQSWNGYSYGLNSPLKYADPSGMTTCDSNGNNCHDETTVTAQAQGLSPLDQLLYRSLFYSLTPLMQVGQQTQQVTQTAADWLS